MESFLSRLDALADARQLRFLDAEFARFIAGRGAGYEMVLAALAASYQLGQNHSYADLKALANADELIPGTGIKSLALPDWLEAIESEALVGEPGTPAAFVLDGHHLYLARYFGFETQVASSLLARAKDLPIDESQLPPLLDKWFGSQEQTPDWQRIAAVLALGRQLAVITGGPGTGKTTTVVRILALLLEQGNVQIRLAAPTGKAATRLASTIKAACGTLDDPVLAASIPQDVSTLHRLLGARPGTLDVRYHRSNPLPLDVLVLDEASMVDLPLMARLLDALPEHARLILLGDKDQLPAVEAGNLLADICQAAGLSGVNSRPQYSSELSQRLQQLCQLEAVANESGQLPMADSLCHLQKSYRFGPDSGIARLANATNSGDSEAVVTLCQGDYGDVTLHSVTEDSLYARVAAGFVPVFEGLESLVPLDALARMESFRAMCALREGPYGVEALNKGIEAELARLGLIDATEEYYPMRPVMVVENDYSVGLFNGDVGLVMNNEQSERVVCFTGSDGELRQVLPARLPAVVSCYAMTVHKSQGSEFDHAAVVLPPMQDGNLIPILTRELVYTAITRAKKQLSLFCDAQTLAEACQRQVDRASGLAARLV